MMTQEMTTMRLSTDMTTKANRTKAVVEAHQVIWTNK
jgi:hypothetical protein